MAFALVGTGALATSAVAGAASPAWGPGARGAGNLLLCYVATFGSTSAPATPAGWLFGTGRSASNTYGVIFYKRATGADAAPVIAGIAGTVINAWVEEWSGLISAGGMVDWTNQGSSFGATCNLDVGGGGTNTKAGELCCVIATAAHSVPVVANLNHAFNKGTMVVSQSNDGASSAGHFSGAYGISNTIAPSDTDVVTHTNPTSLISNWPASGITFYVQNAPLPPTLSPPVLGGSGTQERMLGQTQANNWLSGGGTNGGRFTVAADGFISAVRWMHSVYNNNDPIHVLSLWSEAGVRLFSENYDDGDNMNSDEWIEVPVGNWPVLAGQTYRVTFTCASQQDVSVSTLVGSSSAAPSLTSTGSYSGAGDAFPTTLQASRILVDVVFQTGTPQGAVFSPAAWRTPILAMGFLSRVPVLYAPTGVQLAPVQPMAALLLDSSPDLFGPLLVSRSSGSVPFIDAVAGVWAPTAILVTWKQLTLSLLDAAPDLYAATLLDSAALAAFNLQHDVLVQEYWPGFAESGRRPRQSGPL